MADGIAQLHVHNSGQQTMVSRSYARDPYRWLFPEERDAALLQAVPVVTSGGLVAGDRLAVDVAAATRSHLNVVGQAPEKIYRSNGPRTDMTVALHAGPEVWLEWMPQGTIVFDGARTSRRIAIAADASARLLAGELLFFGRQAMGERFRTGLIDEAWSVRVGGRLIWADRLRLDGDDRLSLPFAFAGAAAYATLIYVGADADAQLAWARSAMPAAFAELRCGVTALDRMLICRMFGPDAAALRTSFANTWMAWRHRFGGHAARMPRLWHC